MCVQVFSFFPGQRKFFLCSENLYGALSLIRYLIFLYKSCNLGSTPKNLIFVKCTDNAVEAIGTSLFCVSFEACERLNLIDSVILIGFCLSGAFWVKKL